VNQLLAVAILKRLGHSAHAVANGREVLEALGTASYDLVLMDCQMPEMDGYEATRVIRKGEKEAGNRIPIVALTANAMRADQIKCLDSGMDDYISKPLKKEKLMQAIARWCPDSAVTKGALGVPYDRQCLLNSVDGDLDSVRQLVTLYLRESEEILSQLGRKVELQDVEGIQSAAHRLKGVMLSVGADAVTIANDLQELAQNGKVVDCRERFNTLAVEVRALDQALIQHELAGAAPVK
jgi:CheY-like chemotaxis protein/HPt (histidine-containing phosphotransfer) domain-containing protein